ncbi:ornithine carbamoyltransferase [Amycolatopsis sp. PS_44_ISF1]|uniref:ornithine carbamoyltransferase n=1 Tax=Amycolatopsis sp. PS_44_ISF1 TaxID=2974917 RepID=UPI0028DDC033|nr:ornithine carbamoyltransferase [Amycolatopsis sp. PS_44_ISF1]MDT8913881.1 ornithine carbamoyltransferase [Amycolatopsis sp. PS_44_ISF1]
MTELIAPPGVRTRNLLSLDDLDGGELRALVERGAAHAAGTEHGSPLDGTVVGVYFEKTSTRTRTAFSSGVLRLGGHLITYGPDDLQLNTGETLADTGRVFASMLDVLVARTTLTADALGQLAGHGMPVVNAMNVEEHPTQGLTDLTTLFCRFGRLDGLRVLYVGEGNNSAVALALGLTRFPGTELELRTPPGYGLPGPVKLRAAELAARHGSSIAERHDMAALPGGFDAIYATRWQTTGTSKPDAGWRTVFEPFRVHAGLWERSPEAVFLHDLPAHRGEEVTADVLDGPHSLAFRQAQFKLFSAMAVLEWCGARDVRR